MKSFRTIFFPIIYRFAMPMRRFYWYIFRPQTRGVKCLIQKDGKFLLARLAYAHKSWTVPGGGVKKNESFEEACYREIKEEIGVDLGQIFKIGEYVSKKEHKIDTVVVFYAELFNEQSLILDNVEIKEVGWFTARNLPQPHMPNVKTILEFYEQFQSGRN